MKRFALLVCTIMVLSLPAFCWHCPTGQHWQQVANGTSGATVIEGIPFACFPDNPPPKPDPKPINATLSSSASSTSQASASQSQKQGQSQVATGGNATATGGSASNQGNTQTYTSTYEQVRQAPPAFAPDAFSTAPCRVAGSLGASSPFGGIALGASKSNKDCERTVLANGFFSRGNYTAGCKLLMHVKVIEEAMTFDECIIAVVPKPVEAVIPAPVVPNVTINVPPPVITPVVEVDRKVVAEKPIVVNVTPKPKKHVSHTCPVTVQNGVKVIHEKENN